MGNEEPQNRTAGHEVEKTLCAACRNAINADAKRCPRCQSFQNWRRHLDATNAALALLVALVSILTLGVPALIKAIQAVLPENEAIVMGVAGADRTVINVVAHNHGKAFGVLSPNATVRAKQNGKEITAPAKIENGGPSGDLDYSIEPGETVSFVIRDAYKFLRTNNKRQCKIDFTIRNVRAETERQASATFDCPKTNN